MVAGSHTSPLNNDVNEDVLNGRKYIVIRAIGDSPVRAMIVCSIYEKRGLIYACYVQTEKGVDAQKRLIKEFYETVGDYTPQ